MSVTAVRRFSPPHTRLVVVDNASTDGSRQWLRSRPDIRAVLLDRNVGHGVALDVGFLSARTRRVVALDVDAFPVRDDWLDQINAGLDHGAAVSGAHGGWIIDQFTADVPEEWRYRDFVHPCCLGMRLRRFVWRSHSFQGQPARRRRLDPAEAICERERGRLHYLEPTSIEGPGVLGTVFGECVYHNFYGIRHRRQQPLIDGITAEQSRATWKRAVARYLDA